MIHKYVLLTTVVVLAHLQLLVDTAVELPLVHFASSARGGCRLVYDSFDIGDRSSCTFIRREDVDDKRVPRVLPIVQCRCRGTRCSNMGDFTCQETRTTFEVAYPGGSGCNDWEYKNVTLTTGCVCATPRSVRVIIGMRQRQLSADFPVGPSIM